MTLLFLAFCFLLIRLGIAWGNVLTRPVLRSRGEMRQSPFVSILVPARNEEKNLPGLFQAISRLRYSNVELIVLNDHSEDGTEDLLKELCGENDRFQYINGKELPEGWLGKNWACHQLAEVAEGDYFLFLDADVAFLNPHLIDVLLSSREALDTQLISVFPDQLMLNLGERLVVPIMHYLLLSMLPLWWIYRLRFPSMAAANGQLMFFEGESYRTQQWHQQMRNSIVEDIAIMQAVKQQGLKGMTFTGGGFISTRMYQSYREGLSGFSKNLLAGFGNSIVGLLGYLSLTVFLPLSGLSQIAFTSLEMRSMALVVAWCVGVIALRIGISILARQAIWRNILLHPFQIITLLVISGLSMFKTITGTLEWKGRKLP